MSNKQKNLLEPSFDSLRLSFPLDLVEIKDNRVLNKVVHYQVTRSDTGEVIEEKFNETNSELLYFEDEPTYNIKVRIENWFGSKYLSILLNSKILEGQYLEGLTLGNIRNAYDKLQSKLFNMTFEDFLQGRPSDFDIKKDIYCPSVEEFDTFTTELEKASPKKKEKEHGVNRFAKKHNKGIEWNRRERSSLANPFTKLYHKGIEAKYGDNHLFFEKYIPEEETNHRARLEVTVKNKNQAERLGIDSSTLLALLSTSKDALHKVIDNAIDKNLEPRKPLKKARNTDELSPMDKLAYLHLTNMIQNQQYDIDRAIDWTISQESHKVKRARLKKKLLSIYNEQIKGQEWEVRTAKMSKFFDAIGWK